MIHKKGSLFAPKSLKINGFDNIELDLIYSKFGLYKSILIDFLESIKYLRALLLYILQTQHIK